MKISYNWLKKYIQINNKPDDVAQILTDTGLEVEGSEAISSVKGGLEHVIVGEIKEVMQHPNADRLKLTMVDVGEDELLQIVCGAPNVAVEQKVVVAQVGATLYPNPEEPFKIKKSKIRGEVSMGMICAEDELGLGESHDGIMVLPEDTEVGLAAAEYFEVENDVIFEIGLTPNRADAMGHIGVARDLKAYFNYHKQSDLEIQWPEIPEIHYTDDLPVQIKVENKEACPNYKGVYLKRVQVGPSPNWLKNKLAAIGLKPINNVVDITNFVLHEVGCPLHAFDGTVVDGKIVVRNAKHEELFTTLDGVERKLTQADLVIANAKEPMCIAGVFGGDRSGVTEKTTEVFLEAAYFDPVSVRKTAKRHALNTDASFRFERGIDPQKVQYALERATSLMVEITGGVVASGRYNEGDTPDEFHEVDFNPDKARLLMGANISNDHMESILGDLDMEVNVGEHQWKVKVPAYRVDVTRQADLVEEVLRIYGLNKIEVPGRMKLSLVQENKPTPHEIKNKARRVLAATGGQEIMNNTLTSSSIYEALKIQPDYALVELLNPLSNELDVMRQTMMFGVLQSLAYNKNRQQKVLRFFEFGKVYGKKDGQYLEEEELILALNGDTHDESWQNEGHQVSYYNIKAWVMHLLSQMFDTSDISWGETDNPFYQMCITIEKNGKVIGHLGQVAGKVAQHFDVKDDTFVGVLNWSYLVKKVQKSDIQYTEIPKYPEVRRDFSLLIDNEVKFDSIKTLAQNEVKGILKKVDLFDVYEGDQLEEGKKSYAVQFIFQDRQKTLQDKQVDQAMDRIQKKLEKELNAQLR